MRIPVLSGVIDRRILVNYRVDPSVLARFLPAPFRPKLVGGLGIAGICLIRLKDIRPKFLPPPLGIGSENAAHRIAVEWRQGGQRLEGVYVSRRDTSSRLNVTAGGRLFPGVHRLARFYVNEHDGYYEIALHGNDGAPQVSVAAKITERLPKGSAFNSLDAASAFFETGSVGYSDSGNPRRFDGLELRCMKWEMTPLEVMNVESSFFDDREKFPAGSAVFDCALLMRDIRHEWHRCDGICCGQAS